MKNVVLVVLAVLLLGVFALRAEDDTGSPFIALGEKLDEEQKILMKDLWDFMN